MILVEKRLELVGSLFEGIWCTASALFLCAETLREYFCMGKHTVMYLVLSTSPHAGYRVRSNGDQYLDLEEYPAGIPDWATHFLYRALRQALQRAERLADGEPVYLSVELEG